jgi:uncharacterized protein YbjT (DUF2867 family)
MRVVLFGATGMVGQGVLRECLLSPEVDSVLVVGRSSVGKQHPKLTEVLVPDLAALGEVRDQLSGMDACFFCLGISSVGMKEPEYRHITYDIAVNAGKLLAELNPGMTFVYVSGAGTDGKGMWAKVKKETEQALLALPLNAFMFRPGFIEPLYGITSKTRTYRVLYTLGRPIFWLFKRLAPRQTLTTESLGKAMIAVARTGAPKRVLEAPDINDLA